MGRLADDMYLKDVEMELESLLAGSKHAMPEPSNDHNDSSDLESLEEEFSELESFLFKSGDDPEQKEKVNVLIDTLEKAKTLVDELKTSSTSGKNDEPIQKRLGQVESAVAQAQELLERLEAELREIRQAVDEH